MTENRAYAESGTGSPAGADGTECRHLAEARTVGARVAAGSSCSSSLVLPYVASTRIVRDRIAHEMSEWSGSRSHRRGARDQRVAGPSGEPDRRHAVAARQRTRR